jgi:hypothetical protein
VNQGGGGPGVSLGLADSGLQGRRRTKLKNIFKN